MTLHLIKLCVGCDSIKELDGWIRQRMREKKKRGQKAEHVHTTRMMPKRAEDLLDGGSLYWVIRGQVMCRERLRAIRPVVDGDGVGRCQLVLEPRIVAVEPRPFRAFQGWRYLAASDAPRDLDQAAPGAKKMPEAMRRQLRELGLL